MGETLTVHEYERFTPLRVEEQGLKGRYRNVKPGDCIVAFSRKDIFTIKQVRCSLSTPQVMEMRYFDHWLSLDLIAS